jgi:hypothetical protein
VHRGTPHLKTSDFARGGRPAALRNLLLAENSTELEISARTI